MSKLCLHVSIELTWRVNCWCKKKMWMVEFFVLCKKINDCTASIDTENRCRCVTKFVIAFNVVGCFDCFSLERWFISWAFLNVHSLCYWLSRAMNELRSHDTSDALYLEAKWNYYHDTLTSRQQFTDTQSTIFKSSIRLIFNFEIKKNIEKKY